MGWESRITELLPPEQFLPAIGQGAIGIEIRIHDQHVAGLVAQLNDPRTATRIAAERALNERLQGGCQVPIAGYSEIGHGVIVLRALVGRPDGSELVQGVISGRPEDAEELGRVLADDLLSRGAREILADVYGEMP
jgi:hydroxymethylbilane synthase